MNIVILFHFLQELLLSTGRLVWLLHDQDVFLFFALQPGWLSAYLGQSAGKVSPDISTPLPTHVCVCVCVCVCVGE